MTEQEPQGFAMIPNWLARSTSLSPAAKTLYVALSSRVGRTRVVWPSQERLVAETGLSESTLRRALRVLERAGLVETRVEVTATGRRNSYVLHTSIQQGGSGHTDRMGPVTVTGKEEPSEQEPSSTHPPPTSNGGVGRGQDTRRGRMTNSWTPTDGALASAVGFRNVDVGLQVSAFRGWHMGLDPVVRSADQWDGMFVSWCARKQEEWEKQNPSESGVQFDETTGLPINPRPQQFAD